MWQFSDFLICLWEKMEDSSESNMVISVIALHEGNGHRIEVIEILRPRASFDSKMMFHQFCIDQIPFEIKNIDLLIGVFDQLSVGIQNGRFVVVKVSIG